ncbi:unnamed protein product [Acanthoscelides obtectus]|uniref:Immunoglobulin-like beta-sandwich domain-containing protein n=1 Tax=Acanthoscelides obtectus TaxID=200917 RepID=A0A9P0M1D2_ACAOB|nr:unnamed protein product [Acanthoscelides obtectus]CAK1659234.1 hypothetical protein AOBTE_LOCUS21364 [Acanthoscelides obtectus]
MSSPPSSNYSKLLDTIVYCGKLLNKRRILHPIRNRNGISVSGKQPVPTGQKAAAAAATQHGCHAEQAHILRGPNRNMKRDRVAWIHIDRQMILTIHRHVISKVPRYSVTNDNDKTWMLHVNGVQQEDKGYYMCQVNTNPMISQVGYLKVVGELNYL